jgi:hypothetical protein
MTPAGAAVRFEHGRLVEKNKSIPARAGHNKQRSPQQLVETMTNPAPYDVYSCSFLPA